MTALYWRRVACLLHKGQWSEAHRLCQLGGVTQRGWVNAVTGGFFLTPRDGSPRPDPTGFFATLSSDTEAVSRHAREWMTQAATDAERRLRMRTSGAQLRQHIDALMEMR